MPSKTTTSSVEHRRSRFDVALLIALVPVAGAAVRIWMYSGGDVAVFLVLLRTLNIPAVLIGTCLLIVPGLLLLALVILLSDWKARDWTKNWLTSHRWIAPAFPIIFFLLLYTVSWTILIPLGVLGVLTAAYFLTRRFWPWGKKHITDIAIAEREDRNSPASIITVIGVLVIFLITPTNMWLPLEKVGITKADDQVAYVLESTAEWTTLLSPDRKVEVIATSDIESRSVCRTSGGGSLTTLLYPSDLSNVPDCTD